MSFLCPFPASSSFRKSSICRVLFTVALLLLGLNLHNPDLLRNPDLFRGSLGGQNAASSALGPSSAIAKGLSANAPANITYTEQPRSFSLIPRDTTSNLGEVRFSGTVNEPGAEEIIVRAFAGEEGATPAGNCNEDSEAHAAVRQALAPQNDNGAEFSLTVPIEAQLTNYQLEVCLRTSSGEQVDKTVSNLVAGDVYLIQGQSNANAFKRSDSSASSNESQYIRSFGSRITSFDAPDSNGNGQSDDLDALRGDLGWHLADGDGSQTAGAVGQWGIRLARRIVDEFGIPVAILNQAVPGTTIGQHQRDDGNPMRLDGFNSGGIYGRLLWRAEQAKVTNQARAILWYQGESDHGDAAGHLSGFKALYQDWLEDYGGLELIYVHQIRNVGTLCNSHDPQLRENQRQMGHDPSLSKVRLMSTTGIDAQADGCHFPYTDGYEKIGDNLFRLMARDLYGETQRTDVEPPDVDFAYFSDANRGEITIALKNPSDTYSWANGAEEDFDLSDGSVSVTAGRVEENRIALTLNTPATSDTALHYFGHPGVNPPASDPRQGQWVTNANGVGLLAFYNVPVALDLPQIQVTVENNQLTSYRGSTLTLNLTLFDADGMAGLQLFAGNELLFSQTYSDAPKNVVESVEWTPSELGAFTIRAAVTDQANARSQHTGPTIEIVNQQPSVLIHSIVPEGPLVVGDGLATVSAIVRDPDGQVTSIQLLVNGVVVEQINSNAAIDAGDFNWEPTEAGQFILSARAIDNDGEMTDSDPVSIDVLMPTPTPVVTNTPTATPTPSLTPTTVATPTPSFTPTATATSPPTATPTVTLTPKPATLSVLPKVGAPGSVFTVAGESLPPNESLNITVNRILVGTTATDQNGTFKVLLAADVASKQGAYVVHVAHNSGQEFELEAAYTIDPDAALGTSQEELEQIALPSSLGAVYLPITTGSGQ